MSFDLLRITTLVFIVLIFVLIIMYVSDFGNIQHIRNSLNVCFGSLVILLAINGIRYSIERYEESVKRK